YDTSAASGCLSEQFRRARRRRTETIALIHVMTIDACRLYLDQDFAWFGARDRTLFRLQHDRPAMLGDGNGRHEIWYRRLLDHLVLLGNRVADCRSRASFSRRWNEPKMLCMNRSLGNHIHLRDVRERCRSMPDGCMLRGQPNSPGEFDG